MNTMYLSIEARDKYDELVEKIKGLVEVKKHYCIGTSYLDVRKDSDGIELIGSNTPYGYLISPDQVEDVLLLMQLEVDQDCIEVIHPGKQRSY